MVTSHLIADRCIAPRFDKIAEKDYNAYMLKGCHRLNGQASEQDSKKWLAAQFGRPGRLFSFLWSFRLSRRIVWTTPITVAKAPMNATISSAASIISITSVWWIWHNSPVGGRIFSRPPTIKARKARPLTTHKALRVTSVKEIIPNFRHDFHRIIGDLNEFLPYNAEFAGKFCAAHQRWEPLRWAKPISSHKLWPVIAQQVRDSAVNSNDEASLSGCFW